MPDASFALQKAMVAALAGDADLGALVGDRIYDAAPRNAVFPYVSIGQANVADWSTGTEAGAEHTLVLHTWSRVAGKKESYAIGAAVESVLHDASLALDGHHLVNLRFEFAEVTRDRDGITYHGVARFRAVTEPV
jgi:hypothetical protein